MPDAANAPDDPGPAVHRPKPTARSTSVDTPFAHGWAQGCVVEKDHFLTVPKVTPRSNWFCNRKVTKKIGIRNKVTIAASNP